MAKHKVPRHHDWTKEQPHHATTGKFTTRAFAEKHPEKVEWVRNKN